MHEKQDFSTKFNTFSFRSYHFAISLLVYSFVFCKNYSFSFTYYFTVFSLLQCPCSDSEAGEIFSTSLSDILNDRAISYLQACLKLSRCRSIQQWTLQGTLLICMLKQPRAAAAPPPAIVWSLNSAGLDFCLWHHHRGTAFLWPLAENTELSRQQINIYEMHKGINDYINIEVLACLTKQGGKEMSLYWNQHPPVGDLLVGPSVQDLMKQQPLPTSQNQLPLQPLLIFLTSQKGKYTQV